MAIFRECKHSFRIVQALFVKSASTLVFSATSGSSSATLRLSERGAESCSGTSEREQGRCDSSKGTNFARVLADIVSCC